MAIAYLYMHDPTESTEFTKSYLDQIVQVAGWGDTAGVGTLSDSLKKIDQKIMDKADCQTFFSDNGIPFTLLAEHLCMQQTGATVQVSFNCSCH